LIAFEGGSAQGAIEQLLSSRGHRAQKAANGLAALDAARREPPHAIVSDIVLPRMDGFALCRKWKQDERLQTIPFLFYTRRHDDPKYERFALELGAERFLARSVSPDSLVTALDELLARHAKNGGGGTMPLPALDETVVQRRLVAEKAQRAAEQCAALTNPHGESGPYRDDRSGLKADVLHLAIECYRRQLITKDKLAEIGGRLQLAALPKAKLLELELKRNELLRKFTPGYLPVQQVTEEIAEVWTALHDAESRPVTSQTTDQNPTHQWLRDERARVTAERDAFGLPRLAARCVLGADDHRNAEDTLRALGETLMRLERGRVRLNNDRIYLQVDGQGHTLGTTRMGEDPATSVVDRWCAAHDVPNLYVLDGAVFPTSGPMAPTATICANSLRCTARLIERAGLQPVPA
jgi:CheY-like chemotaxis protein